MKCLIPILLIFTACNKENSLKMSSTIALKAIPEATVSGKNITLNASKSQGAITSYGWQLDISSPTYSPVSYTPSSSVKSSEFKDIVASVNKTGTYIFTLMVYDSEGHTNSANINVEVK